MIGTGPSGLDLVMMLSKVAKSVSVSRKTSSANVTKDELEKEKNALPNVSLKNRVRRFRPDGVEFTDGTRQTFSSIIYATGEENVHLRNNQAIIDFENYLFRL